MRAHSLKLVLVVAALVAGLGTTRADEDYDKLTERVRQLEELVRQMQEREERRNREEAELPPPRPVPPEEKEGLPPAIPPGPPPLPGSPPPSTTSLEQRRTGDALKPMAGWNDCFFLQSADQSFVFRLTGQVQTDYREFLDAGDTVDIDSFLVRRARIGVEAILYKNYEFRLMPDFGNGETRLLDAYLNIRYWDEFQFEIGKFKQPFSYEELVQDRFFPLMERSIFWQLTPRREVGAALHGQKLFRDRVDYGISICNGVSMGDTDTNDAKDVVARVVYRPFKCLEEHPWIQSFQYGISGNFGDQQELMRPNPLRTPATVPFFWFSPAAFADGQRMRMSPEVAWFVGPFGFAAQYFWMKQEMRAARESPGRVDVPITGWYVLGSWLLTGEKRTTYSQAVAPLRPFSPYHASFGPGAWELVARVSELRLSDKVFTEGLADPAISSNGALEMTLGFNWYLNKWVRTQLNWEHAWFDDPVRLGPGPEGLLNHQDTVSVRMQIIF